MLTGRVVYGDAFYYKFIFVWFQHHVRLMRLSEGEKLGAELQTWVCYQATVMLAKLILSAGCCIAAIMATPNWSRIWNLFPVFSFGLCARKLLVRSTRFLCFISNLPNSYQSAYQL